MSGQGLWPSLLAVAGILLFSTVAGRLFAVALFPRGPGWNLERWGWSMAVAALLLPLDVCLPFAFGARPGWIWLLVLTALGIALARRFALSRGDPSPENSPGPSIVSWLLFALTAAGVLAYLVGCLEGPMATNDFFAIWGLKGKAMFGAAGMPRWLFHWPEFAFSHPEYPVGLPLLYAGIAFLLGRWDDQAIGLLFPFLQVGTLLVLAGWLRRRGAAMGVALASTALVANFGYLYSPYLTGGMAEVPASLTFLLVGTAFCDVVDRTDRGCLRRLSLAALLAASTKNEGLFLLGTALAILFLRSVRRREPPIRGAVAAIAVPALASFFLHRLALGSHPLRDFDFSVLWRSGLPSRVAATLREEFAQLVVPAWPALAALALLAALSRLRPASGRILALAGASLAAYLILPAFCTYGPAWLVHWTVGRVTAALAPLAAAGFGNAWTPAGRGSLTQLEVLR